MISAAATGFFTSFSLILAIGAQNALVLRQGLARSHVFWTCLFCGVSDAIFIFAGVAGFAKLVNYFPWMPTVFVWGGIFFLVIYALLRLLAAYKGEYDAEIEGKTKSLSAVIIMLAGVTFLNPHVYLDTLVLIGSISLQFVDGEKIAFGAGAITASIVFFFSLGYGAQLMAPLFKSAKVWRILDIAIAGVMLAIALGLYLNH